MPGISNQNNDEAAETSTTEPDIKTSTSARNPMSRAMVISQERKFKKQKKLNYQL